MFTHCKSRLQENINIDFPIESETTLHVFCKCSVTKILWNRLLLFFETDLDTHDLTLQAVFLVLLMN